MAVRKIVFTLGLSALLATSLVSAQSSGQLPSQSSQSKERAGAPSFADLDKSHSGHLKRSDIPKDVEQLKSLRSHFVDYDLNHDGTISQDEYESYLGQTN